MEFNQETRLAHKRAFIEFLDQDNRRGEYAKKVATLIEKNLHRLLVDVTDLRKYDHDLARRVIMNPGEFIEPFEEALVEVTRNYYPKFLSEEEEMHIGFDGLFGSHRLTPRNLLSTYLNSLVCLEGIVTKCSIVRPKVVRSVHFCPRTNEFHKREYRDASSFTGLPTSSVYPTKDDNGNLLVTEFGLCKYRDHQVICMQEMPENSPPGQLPKSVDVILENDLVDICKPGDRICVVGVYRAVPNKSLSGLTSNFRTVIIANNLSQLNRDIESPVFSADDLRNIRMIAKRKDCWDLLSQSLVPSIFGHSWIKKAMLLLLLGGMEKNLANGTHLRGDINILLVGDPSVAKSQILRSIMGIAPLAISTTGKGSSGVGLTAAVTSDMETGEKRLEAGAMVLADRGIVCIDEFDKMNDVDRVAIHEVMEQQTVTISKAGIHASLNARCSVLAAANPIYGNYDHSIPPAKNISLPDSLLSRFDLLFIVLDHMDVDMDKRISEHVLRMHRYRNPGDDDGIPASAFSSARRFSFSNNNEETNEESSIFVKYNRILHGEKKKGTNKNEILSKSFLKKFIHYARGRTPKLTEEASDKIAHIYASMREQNMSANVKSENAGVLPITARSLECIIRLSTAVAKMKLNKEITPNDVQSALDLIDFALYHRDMTAMKEKEQSERENGIKINDDHERGDENGGENRAENDVEMKDDDLPPQKSQKSKKRKMSPVHNSESMGNENKRQEISMEQDDRDVFMARPELDLLIQAQNVSSVTVSPERSERFRQALSSHVISTRSESLTIQQVMNVVNSSREGGSRDPFSREEIDAILLQMEEENRLMYSNGVVHMI